jgi:hypothetical protein
VHRRAFLMISHRSIITPGTVARQRWRGMATCGLAADNSQSN